MDATDKKHAVNLREALLKLHHSGPIGFEGLLGILLGHVTGHTFRLASSGTQRGRDGSSAFDTGATYFEAKRYRQSPDKKEIAAKLYDLAIDEVGQVDLWVLGATCEVAAQTAQDAESFAARHGIGVVVLDWADNDLGALLVATVVAGDKAKSFIKNGLEHTSHAHLIPQTFAAIDYFAIHPDLPNRLSELRSALSLKEAGLGSAKALNAAWMEKLFTNRALARAEFGQPLAPLDPIGLLAAARPEQIQLYEAFSGVSPTPIYAVIGEEGVGKSWICAKTWLETGLRSLLVIASADELLSPEATLDFEAFLNRLLIRQTGWQSSERVLERWRRRLRGWRANPASSVRVTLVIDGLNQPRKVDWGRWINRAAAVLGEIGGCMIITTRSAHWNQLRPSLTAEIKEIWLGPWPILEVKSLLAGKGIDPKRVEPPVLESLRNPRLLGIAMDLLEAKDIELMGQLSVGRLIFEHMRKAQMTGAVPMSGTDFAAVLQKLAKEVLTRTQAKQMDDVRMFNAATEDVLHSVATSRFFVTVPGSPQQYEINAEGLNLGIALSVINDLEKEQRNGREPRERLGMLLEPIAALDDVGKIVFLAVQIVCLEPDHTDNVKAALIERLISLQNLPKGEADAFALLMKASPRAFLLAAENAHCSSTHYLNIDWLLYALLTHRDNPNVWPEVAKFVRRWLSLYSLAPERMMFKTSRRDAVDEVAKERSKRTEELKLKTANLTAEERVFVDTKLIHVDRWDYDSLHRMTFFILAGRPLEEFADIFVRWSFADAYTPAIFTADKEFRQLIRFNRVDWVETRLALLRSLAGLLGDKSSDIGKWARVEILRAIGGAADSVESEALAVWLTRDLEKFPSWSLIRDYCAADPCDPGTVKPENVDKTASEYRSIDVSALAEGRGRTRDDHFFEMARCGVVRFCIDEAKFVHRNLANAVLKRSEFPRRQGVLALREHASILNHQQVIDFLAAGQRSCSSFQDAGEEWLTAQYSILLAIPHLAPDDQLEAIKNIQGETILLDTLRALKAASTDKIEAILQTALDENQSVQEKILAAIQYSGAPLSNRALDCIGVLAKSADATVRGQAFQIIAHSADDKLLKQVAGSSWDSRDLDEGNDSWERWHGSSAILAAAVAGHLPLDNALDRMHFDHYGFAACELGTAGAVAVASRVDAFLKKALGYESLLAHPEIETTTPDAGSPAPPLISLSDPPPQDREDQWTRLGESGADFDKRRQHRNEAFTAFVNDLTAAKATLILSDLTYRGMKAIVEADPVSPSRWLPLLVGAADTQLIFLHHVAVQMALASATTHRSQAILLLERVLKLKPTIRRVHGPSKLPSEVYLLWAAADIPRVEQLCRERLKTRRNDAEIALEVLAAYINGRGIVVAEEIDKLLTRGEPADIVLALTLAGYSDANDHANATIEKFHDIPWGFIAVARDAARAAYDRNVWSRIWYQRMLAATDLTSYWQASVLLSKVVDSRFEAWHQAFGDSGSVHTAFWSGIRSQVERRIEKWHKKREDTLFGDKVPADVFL